MSKATTTDTSPSRTRCHTPCSGTTRTVNALSSSRQQLEKVVWSILTVLRFYIYHQLVRFVDTRSELCSDPGQPTPRHGAIADAPLRAGPAELGGGGVSSDQARDVAPAEWCEWIATGEDELREQC